MIKEIRGSYYTKGTVTRLTKSLAIKITLMIIMLTFSLMKRIFIKRIFYMKRKRHSIRSVLYPLALTPREIHCRSI